MRVWSLSELNLSILDPSLAASLQGTARTLERNIISDRLNNSLEHRVAAAHVPEVVRDQDVAPRLRSAKIALEQAMVRDTLKNALSNRPSPEEMEASNLMVRPDRVASSLQAVQRQLERNMASDKLSQMLEKRQQNDEEPGKLIWGVFISFCHSLVLKFQHPWPLRCKQRNENWH